MRSLLDRVIGILDIFLLVLLILPGCQTRLPEDPAPTLVSGEITENRDIYGSYYLYTPTTPSDPPQTLVVIHGTPAKDLSAGEITDALTGYRGLFGREIGADEWVIRLLGLARAQLGWEESPFLLYGHSAGGQYVGRFLVSLPELVERAVISAAVSYPQPDAKVSWPYGMGALSSEIVWGDGTTTQVEVTPNKEKWLQATQVQVKVIVGMDDLEPQLSRPGQEGKVRLAIGRNWVKAMGEFADENALESQIVFEAIPGKGHSMLGLLPFCQDALRSE